MIDGIKNKKLNFRDLGGIRTKDGDVIRSGLILRSAKLSKLDKRDSSVLSGRYRLRYVIDLRSSVEKDGREDIIPEGAEYVEIPYFNESHMAMTSGMGADVMAAVKNAKSKRELLEYIPELTEVYPLVVTDEYSISQLSLCLKLIMNNRDGACLFHCTAGKDRTGITAAVLLKILGVPYDTIMDDYLATNEVSGKNARKYSFLAKTFLRDKQMAEKVYRVFMAEKEYLDASFSSIDEKFGSFENFVKDGLGLTDEIIVPFKEYILEKKGADA